MQGTTSSGIDIRGLKGTAISQRGFNERPVTGAFGGDEDKSEEDNGAFFGIGTREIEVQPSSKSPTSNSGRITSNNQIDLNIGEE